jgi:hypothetical protein
MSALLETFSRRAIEDEIERLIGMLDQLDGEPDMEEPGDMEPWLGWTSHGRGAVGCDPNLPCNADLESDLGVMPTYTDAGWQHELEQDDADAEPWLGAPEWHPSGHLWDGHTRGSQLDWAAGGSDDREYECEDEGAGGA